MILFSHLHQGLPPSPPLSLPEKIKKWAKGKVRKIPLHPLVFMGKTPKRLLIIPTDPWPGQSQLGRKLLEGSFALGHETLSTQDLWYPTHLSEAALFDLHSFEWLRDLRSIGDNASRRMARHLILHWIDHNKNWKHKGWDPELVGLRLSNWVGLYDFFAASADEGFCTLFLKSLMQQTRYLLRFWECAPTVTHKLLALHGLIVSSIALNIHPQRLPFLTKSLENLIDSQILPDGGHYSRSPLLHLSVLRLLIDLRSLFRQLHQTIPEKIQKIISTMAPILRLFRHSDGHLACFGPYQSGHSNLIDVVLSLADVRGRPPTRAQSMGYERCTSKSGMILVNTRPTSYKSPTHQLEKGIGLFNFEWSSTKQRIITYGDCLIQTLSGDNIEAVETKKRSISTHQSYHSQGVVFEGTYFYTSPHQSIDFQQTLFLNNDSFDFRGETKVRGVEPYLAAVRFVFHPSLTLHPIPHKRLMIQSPHGPRWILMASGHEEWQFEQTKDETESFFLLLLSRVEAKTYKKIQWVFSQIE